MAEDPSNASPAAPPSSPATPAPSAPAGGTVRLAVPHPYSTFDHGIDGAPQITSEGVDVPQGLVKKLQSAWSRAFGVEEADTALVVIEPDTAETKVN